MVVAALTAEPPSATAGPGGLQRPAPRTEPFRLQAAAASLPAEPGESQQRALERLRIAAGEGAQRARGSRTGREQWRAGPAGEAHWVLGLLALHGLAMPLDAARAELHFEQARRLGHRLAPAGLAWCAIDGCEGWPQPAAARRWTALLQAADPGRALYLEWLLEQRTAPLEVAPPRAEDAPAPTVPGHELLVRAAAAGDPQAQNELGLRQVAAGRPREALALFQAASRRSVAAAYNAALLADELRAGATGSRGGGATVDWFMAARRYHRGEGVVANFTEAIRLYRLAAAEGDARAQRMLELIVSRPAPDGGVDISWMQQLGQLAVPPFGTVTILPAAKTPALRRDPTPLYDLVPPPWRTQ